MGAFLFYILKSTFCLLIFYVFFRALMSRSTFFRFNRLTLLVGMSCCLLLPLLVFTTSKENLLQIPFHTMQQALVEDASGFLLPEEELKQVEGVTGYTDHGTVPTPLSSFNYPFSFYAGIIYVTGACMVFLLFAVSTYRMVRLIRRAKKKKYKAYTLALTAHPVCSFSWGSYIVMSEADYSHDSEEILLHESVHLRSYHTLDLLFMQCFLILHWFNPAVWLLRRELQEIHEYEADHGVIHIGIDATRYQLLLVKKAVGTRLYSMANGFNHSKLKNRITMMLKERTNQWARLKLLLFVPVMAGTLYAFAQPEVKESLSKITPEITQERPQSYLELSRLLRQEEETYNLRRFGKKNRELVRKFQVHKLLVNANNQILFNGNALTKENLKPKIVKDLLDRKQEALTKYERKEEQIIAFQCDRGSDVEEVRQILQMAYDAYTEIRDSIATKANNNSKDFLDEEFPVLINENEMKKYGKDTDILEGVAIEFIVNDGGVSKKLENPTLAELQQTCKEYQSNSKELPVIRLKFGPNCKMGMADKVRKTIGDLF